MADGLDEAFPEPQVETPVEDVAPEPEAVVEPPVIVDEPPQVDAIPEVEADKSIPLATFLDIRDERNALKRELEAARRQQPQQQQPAEVPDPFDNPSEFAAYTQQLVDQRTNQVRFEMSDAMARQVHGADTVDTAIAWAQERASSDPMFAAGYMKQPNPIDWIVQQHKRDSVVSQIGDRPLDDFIRDYVAKNPTILAGTAPVAAPVAAPQASAPAKVPPRSLASQGSGPSDIREVATGPLAGVDAIFS